LPYPIPAAQRERTSATARRPRRRQVDAHGRLRIIQLLRRRSCSTAGHRGAAPPLDRMGCGLAAGARGAAQRARAQGAADGAIGTADAV